MECKAWLFFFQFMAANGILQGARGEATAAKRVDEISDGPIFGYAAKIVIPVPKKHQWRVPNDLLARVANRNKKA